MNICPIQTGSKKKKKRKNAPIDLRNVDERGFFKIFEN